MQTFLPYDSFIKSADCLDKRRCLKQVVEASQIINVIFKIKNGDKKIGWRNHPAVKMWESYENALILYYNEFLKIGKDKWNIRWNKMKEEVIVGEIVYPKWFGNEIFHSSHRANLLRKDKLYYGQFGWVEQPFDSLGNPTPYVWPAVERD